MGGANASGSNLGLGCKMRLATARTASTANTEFAIVRAATHKKYLLMLPGIAGLDVLRQLRNSSKLPVIILTARGEEVDRVFGLEIGAADYLAKPFSPRELIARLRAVLGRATPSHSATETLDVAGISLNSAAREAWLDGVKLNLTGLEFSLLEVLLHNAGRLVSREQLTETVLGRKLVACDRVIDVYVSNLRKKLGPDRNGERIKAVRRSTKRTGALAYNTHRNGTLYGANSH